MLGDHLPNAVGGLPEGAPARPAADTAYPAVHNVPPARDRASANADTPATTGSTSDSKAASARNQ